MNEHTETEEKDRIRARHFRIVIVAAFLLSSVALVADTSVRHALAATAKQIGNGRWSEAADSYVTYFNFLFRPETGAAARIDAEVD
jgi:hypothetical protein